MGEKAFFDGNHGASISWKSKKQYFQKLETDKLRGKQTKSNFFDKVKLWSLTVHTHSLPTLFEVQNDLEAFEALKMF